MSLGLKIFVKNVLRSWMCGVLFGTLIKLTNLIKKRIISFYTMKYLTNYVVYLLTSATPSLKVQIIKMKKKTNPKNGINTYNTPAVTSYYTTTCLRR